MLLSLLLGVALIAIVGGLLWWRQRIPLAPGSFARRAPLDAMMRLRRSTILAVMTLAVLLCLGTVALVRLSWPGGKTQKAQPVPAAPGKSSVNTAFLNTFPERYPTEMAPLPPLPPKGVPMTPPAPGPQVAQAQPAPPAPPTRAEVERMITDAQARAMQAQTAALEQQTQRFEQALARLAAQQQARPATPAVPQDKLVERQIKADDAQQAKQKRDWGAAKPESIQAKREDTKEERELNPDRKTPANLLQPATWVQPLHPERVLYRDQFLPGVLVDAANSDAPGQLRVMVTRDVLDRFLRGTVLVPQLSTLVGTLQGKATYGQQRFDITMDQVIFPDGTILDLGQSKLGEGDGSGGMAANVNNHYVKLFAAVILNAGMSIGINSVGGTPNGFYADPIQQGARDAAQGFSQAGRDIIRRELMVPPTLTQAIGHEVTVHPAQNIDLSLAPVRVVERSK